MFEYFARFGAIVKKCHKSLTIKQSILDEFWEKTKIKLPELMKTCDILFFFFFCNHDFASADFAVWSSNCGGALSTTVKGKFRIVVANCERNSLCSRHKIQFARLASRSGCYIGKIFKLSSFSR